MSPSEAIVLLLKIQADYAWSVGCNEILNQMFSYYDQEE